MQKNFKYPLAIEGTKEQLTDIGEELRKLGYTIEYAFYDNSQGLVTHYGDVPYRVSTVTNVTSWLFINNNHNKPRLYVSASNRDLVLALAAMVDDDKFYKDEYVVALEDHNPIYGRKPQFLKGHLYQISHDGTGRVHEDELGQDNGWSVDAFRKATKEEIINHFKNMDQPKNLCAVDETTPHTISAPISLIKALHEGADQEWKSILEEEFPTVFPRPTFRIGDRILVTVPEGQLLLMIAGTADVKATGHRRIALVNLFTGLVKSETVAIDDADKITESQMIEAGSGFGVTKNNYTKLDCSVQMEFYSCYDQK